MVQTFDEYQKWARRTRVGMGLNDQEYLFHAVFGLTSEAGEVAGILQKTTRGMCSTKRTWHWKWATVCG